MDRFAGGFSYSPRSLIGFDAAEVDHGGRSSAMGGVRPLVVVECDPATDACLGLRAGLPGVQASSMLAQSPASSTAISRILAGLEKHFAIGAGGLPPTEDILHSDEQVLE